MLKVNPEIEQLLPDDPLRHLKLASVNDVTSVQRDFAQSHAILIGINDYANGIQRLTTATHDAEVLAALLREQHGYQVQALTTAVSKGALTELFTKRLPATIQADDRLLVYFAGHGIALDGDDGPAGYLIPQDARPEAPESFLAMRDFNQWLSQLRCRHLLVILDCCFAGAFRWASTRSLKPLPDMLYRERFERFIRDPAWQVLTSAAYDQKALDFLTGNSLGERGQQNGHSPFAQALFAALAGKGDLVPAGGDGVITATELYLYLRDFVEVAAEQQAHHRQTPGLWPLQRHDKGEFIFFVPGQEVKLEPAPPLTAENNPYRGLASYNYSTQDARLFFGRTKLIEKLAELVEQHGLTLVLGASGTGKSSLVKAGLLPRLHPPEAEPAGDTVWQVLPPMRPTDQPLRVLHHLLTHNLADGQAGEMLADLSRLTEALVKLVHDWCKAHAGQRLLLMVDQMEELITLCRNDAERTAFLDLLAALLHSQSNQLRIVLTLRSDFEPQFAKSLLFTQPTPPVARFIVPPLSQDELREVIEGPAAASTLFFEDSQLVDDLINEVVQTPGALPLLSFTLEQLYLRYLQRQAEGRNEGVTIDRSLTRRDYQALGGVIGSLNQRASEEYTKLPDDAHRATLQRVMLRMVAVEGGELARRRVALEELTYTSDEENGRVQTALRQFVNARLLVRGQADTDGDGKADVYVEPAHDALVRAWDELLVWKRKADEYLPLQRRLTQAANEWEYAPPKNKLGLLWSNDPRLSQIQHTLSGGIAHPNMPFWSLLATLSQFWQSFYPQLNDGDGSTWLNRREIKFIQISIQQRAQNLRRLVFSMTATLVVILSVLAAAFFFQRQSTLNSSMAFSRQLAASSGNALANQNPELGLLLAVESIRATQRLNGTVTVEAEAALYQALASPFRGRWYEVIREPDTQILPEHWSEIVAGVTAERDVDYMPAPQGGEVHFSFADYIESLSFNPDETRFVTAGCRILYVTGGCPAISGQLWDVNDGYLTELDGHNGNVNYVNHSEDGSSILTISEGGTAQLWDSGGILRARIEGVVGDIRSAYSSSDGLQLTTIHNDGIARLWAFNGDLINLIRVRDAELRTVSYHPNGEQIIVTYDGVPFPEVRRLSDGRIVGKVDYTFRNGILTANFSPDGEKILTTHQHKIVMWSKAGKLLWQFDNADSPDAASFNHAGSQFITASADSAAKIWDAQAGKLIMTIPHGKPVKAVNFSPDDAWIATASADGVTRVWNSQDGKPRLEITNTWGVNSLSFDPSGARLLTAGSDGTAKIWSAEDGAIIFVLDNHMAAVNTASFNASGDKVVTGSDDGLVRLWSAATGNLLSIYTGFAGAVNAVHFSPDDQRILAAGADGTVREWRIWRDLDSMIAEATNRAGRNLTVDECQQYLNLEQCPQP